MPSISDPGKKPGVCLLLVLSSSQTGTGSLPPLCWHHPCLFRPPKLPASIWARFSVLSSGTWAICESRRGHTPNATSFDRHRVFQRPPCVPAPHRPSSKATAAAEAARGARGESGLVIRIFGRWKAPEDWVGEPQRVTRW